jgi:hypothetical protein
MLDIVAFTPLVLVIFVHKGNFLSFVTWKWLDPFRSCFSALLDRTRAACHPRFSVPYW